MWLWRRSLRRVAALERRRAATVSRRQKLLDVVRPSLYRFRSSAWPFAWLSGLSALTIWAPGIPETWTVAAFKSESSASSFLQTLWQVDAAAIALSLAVVLFSF